MKHVPQDPQFDAMVEDADLDMSAIAEAEALLRDADAEPVDPAWVEATVARVAVPPVELRPVRRLTLVHRTLRAAAVLLAFVLCTSAGYAVFKALWPGLSYSSFIPDRPSSGTMTYSLAIEILRSGDQPEAAHAAAMLAASNCIRTVIERLENISADTDAPALAAAARAALGQIERQFVEGEPISTDAVDDQLDDVLTMAEDRSSSEQKRLGHLQRTVQLTMAGVSAIREAPDLTPLQDEKRSIYVKQILRLLRQR